MLDLGEVRLDGAFGVTMFVVGEGLVDGGTAIDEYAGAGVWKCGFCLNPSGQGDVWGNSATCVPSVHKCSIIPASFYVPSLPVTIFRFVAVQKRYFRWLVWPAGSVQTF